MLIPSGIERSSFSPAAEFGVPADRRRFIDKATERVGIIFRRLTAVPRRDVTGRRRRVGLRVRAVGDDSAAVRRAVLEERTVAAVAAETAAPRVRVRFLQNGTAVPALRLIVRRRNVAQDDFPALREDRRPGAHPAAAPARAVAAVAALRDAVDEGRRGDRHGSARFFRVDDEAAVRAAAVDFVPGAVDRQRAARRSGQRGVPGDRRKRALNRDVAGQDDFIVVAGRAVELVNRGAQLRMIRNVTNDLGAGNDRRASEEREIKNRASPFFRRLRRSRLSFRRFRLFR